MSSFLWAFLGPKIGKCEEKSVRTEGTSVSPTFPLHPKT
jgi:hypothetical protein